MSTKTKAAHKEHPIGCGCLGCSLEGWRMEDASKRFRDAVHEIDTLREITAQLLESLEQTTDTLKEFTNILKRSLPATASLSKDVLIKAWAAIRKAKGESL